VICPCAMGRSIRRADPTFLPRRPSRSSPRHDHHQRQCTAKYCGVSSIALLLPADLHCLCEEILHQGDVSFTVGVVLFPMLLRNNMVCVVMHIVAGVATPERVKSVS